MSERTQTSRARVSHLRVSEISVPTGHRQIQVDAGHRGVTRIVPPAGERWAFEVDNWARRITVSRAGQTGKRGKVNRWAVAATGPSPAQPEVAPPGGRSTTTGDET